MSRIPPEPLSLGTLWVMTHPTDGSTAEVSCSQGRRLIIVPSLGNGLWSLVNNVCSPVRYKVLSMSATHGIINLLNPVPVFTLYAPNLPDKGGILKSFTTVVVLASFSLYFSQLWVFFKKHSNF